MHQPGTAQLPANPARYIDCQCTIMKVHPYFFFLWITLRCFATLRDAYSALFSSGGQSRRKILDILDSIDICQEQPPVLELEFFNPSVIEQLLASCEQHDEQGVKLCNVKMLHQILTTELNKLQAAAIGQRPLIVQVSDCFHLNSHSDIWGICPLIFVTGAAFLLTGFAFCFVPGDSKHM